MPRRTCSTLDVRPAFAACCLPRIVSDCLISEISDLRAPEGKDRFVNAAARFARVSRLFALTLVLVGCIASTSSITDFVWAIGGSWTGALMQSVRNKVLASSSREADLKNGLG